MFLKSERIYWI